MDNYKIFWNGLDVSNQISALSSTEDIDTLSVSLSFTAVKNPYDRYMPTFAYQPGDKIQLFNNNKSIFNGIITRIGLDGTVYANDFGFYLNKSKIVLQCNGVSASDAIRQMCVHAGVQLGDLPDMPTLITDIFIDNEPSSILSDILDAVTAERGTKYFSRIEPDKGLCVYQYPTSPITLQVQLAKNLRTFDPTWALGSISGDDSIEELRNEVRIYREEDDTVHILATASDPASISKYGWLQHMESADEGVTTAQANQMAKTKLAELNRISSTRSVDEMLGADVRCGEMLQFSSDKFGFSGNWIVKSVTHTYDATPHL